MIFVNGFDNEILLIYHLCNLFLAYMKNDRKRIIRIFTLVLEPYTEEKYLENFYNGDIKI